MSWVAHYQVHPPARCPETRPRPGPGHTLNRDILSSISPNSSFWKCCQRTDTLCRAPLIPLPGFQQHWKFSAFAGLFVRSCSLVITHTHTHIRHAHRRYTQGHSHQRGSKEVLEPTNYTAEPWQSWHLKSIGIKSFRPKNCLFCHVSNVTSAPCAVTKLH